MSVLAFGPKCGKWKTKEGFLEVELPSEGQCWNVITPSFSCDEKDNFNVQLS